MPTLVLPRVAPVEVTAFAARFGGPNFIVAFKGPVLSSSVVTDDFGMVRLLRVVEVAEEGLVRGAGRSSSVVAVRGTVRVRRAGSLDGGGARADDSSSLSATSSLSLEVLACVFDASLALVYAGKGPS